MCFTRQLMNIRFTILGLGLLIFIVNSCGTIIPGKTTARKESYSEDLSAYRPEIVIPKEEYADTVSVEFIADSTTADVSLKLNTVLDTAAIHARSSIKYIDGFTIQVYGGDNRATARDYRLELIRKFPFSEPRMVFEQPNYKVRVGQYFTRLEAQHFFTEIRHVFPKAILIPTRIYIE